MPVRTGHGGSPMAIDRRGVSASPPPAPLSKRDKRRNNITDRLTDMIETFSSEQHQHYRAQLQAIQVDMTLILRANPYNNVPLDDDDEDIEHEIEKITGGNLPHITNDAAKRDYLALAGKRYHDYVQDINRAMEQRDADLTALKNRYDGAMAELERNTSYKIHVAQREHVELATTVRSRLISSVTKKRDKLLREKEQLDIADSSALFLHPSQFTMNIPGSPGGGALNSRKTRFMRHRVGDQEDTAGERGKKRKAVAADDEGTDSAAPSFKPSYKHLAAAENNDSNGAASPFRDAREKTIYSQYEAPVFSIDRLFTDKELAHATTVAQIATHQFFHQQQTSPPNAEAAAVAAQAPLQQPLQTNGHASASAMSLDGSTDAATATAAPATTAGQPTADAAEGASAQANGSPPPSQLQAPEMERAVSHHATRNATRTNPLAALSEAAAMSSTSNFTPHLIPISRTDKGAPTPPGVDMVQAESDISLMFREDDTIPPASSHSNLPAADNSSAASDLPDSSLRNLRNRFLDQACRDAMGNAPFRLPLVETGPAHINFTQGVARLPGYGYADPASMRFHMPNGGVPTSNTAVGAPALPLVNENLAALLPPPGGEAMSRATSFNGSEAGAGFGNGNGNTSLAVNGVSNGDSGAGAGAGGGMRRVRSRLI